MIENHPVKDHHLQATGDDLTYNTDDPLINVSSISVSQGDGFGVQTHAPVIFMAQ